MSSERDARARAIVDAARYMTIATADGDGTPWATPVWFAVEGYRDFVWVSDPEARHSRNVEVRAEVSMVIFDSTAAVGTGEGVYMTARAARVPPHDLLRWTEVFSRRSVAQGAAAWSVDDVEAEASLRLYRAEVSECWLGRRDEREPVSAAYFA